MNRAKNIVEIILLGALSGLALGLTVFSIFLSSLVVDLGSATQQAKDAFHNLGTAAWNTNDALFKKCGKLNCGIADEVSSTVNDIHLAAGQAAVAERDYYTKVLVPRSNTFFDDVHGAVMAANLKQVSADLHTTFTRLNGDGENPDSGLLAKATESLDALRKAITDLDVNLINDPTIRQSLAEIAAILQKTDATMGEVQLISTDVRKIADEIEKRVTAPPTKKQKILAILELVYKAALIDVALKAK